MIYLSASSGSREIFVNLVRSIYCFAQKRGITVGYQLNPTRGGFCIVDCAYQFMIAPNGMLYKCSETFIDNDNVGVFNEKGDYTLKFDRWSRWMYKDPFDDPECITM